MKTKKSQGKIKNITNQQKQPFIFRFKQRNLNRLLHAIHNEPILLPPTSFRLEIKFIVFFFCFSFNF